MIYLDNGATTFPKPVNVINSVNHYHGRRISNGPIESVNARIKSINRNGNGYQNFERFRVRVLYSLNENSGLKGFDN